MANLEQFYEKSNPIAYGLAEKVLITLEKELSAHVYAGYEPISITEKNVSRLIFFQAQEDGIKISPEQLNQAENIIMSVIHNVFVGEGNLDPRSLPDYTAGDLLRLLQKIDPETRIFIDSPKDNSETGAPVHSLESSEGEYKAVSAFQAVVCHVANQKALIITTHY